MRIGIVGGGIAGLSTAWSAVKGGHDVTLYEQGAIPNPLSASGDQHRIIRRAYAGKDGYARRIGDAFEAWEELWSDLGANHLVETGVLMASRYPGDEGDRFVDGLERNGTPYRRFGPEDAAERWPFLDAAEIDYAALADEGGALLCERIAGGLLGWLTANGATVHQNCRVSGVDAERGVVGADGQGMQFDRVVVTAGAWVTGLFPDLAAALEPARTLVVYLDPPADLLDAWEGAPCILSVGGDEVDGYILPPVAGTRLKFGAGATRRPELPDRDREPRPGEGQALRDLFSPPLARIGEYAVRETRTCAYTFTKDEHFATFQRGRTWVVSACSGHGYKFGAAVGRRVAQAVEKDDEAGLLRWIEARD